MVNYTAKYTKIDSGYLGQLIEWPEVVTEGKNLEECRAMLRDALREMVLAYRHLDKETPPGNVLIEQLPVESRPTKSASRPASQPNSDRTTPLRAQPGPKHARSR